MMTQNTTRLEHLNDLKSIPRKNPLLLLRIKRLENMSETEWQAMRAEILALAEQPTQ